MTAKQTFMLNRLLLCLPVLAVTSTFAAAPPEKTFELAITHGVVPKDLRQLRVEKGDAVRLKLTSDAAGDIHLHGYRLAAKLAPGVPAELAFNAYATGRYRIEWHAAGDNSRAGSHHSAPLVTLEVRPR